MHSGSISTRCTHLSVLLGKGERQAHLDVGDSSTEEASLHRLRRTPGENRLLTPPPHLETDTEECEHSPLINGKQGRECKTGASLYDTKPVMFSSERTSVRWGDNSVLLERFLSDSEDDTSGSSVHLAEHLMLKIRHIQKQLFRESMISHSSHPEFCPDSLVMSINTAPLITITVKY